MVNVCVVPRNFRAVVAYQIHRHRLAYAGRLEQGNGGVPQSVEADFALAALSAAPLLFFVPLMRARLHQPRRRKDFIKLIRECSNAPVLRDYVERSGVQWLFRIVAGWQSLDVLPQRLRQWQNPQTRSAKSSFT